MNIKKAITFGTLGLALTTGGWKMNTDATNAYFAHAQAEQSSLEMTKITAINSLLEQKDWRARELSTELESERDKLLSNSRTKMKYDYAQSIKPYNATLKYLGSLGLGCMGIGFLVAAGCNLSKRQTQENK
ncbi:MAG: hypothetical protein AABX07_00005 [Nanoarchaeota archaeon]